MTAVIYARYSSDNQREESIEGQIRECTAYAEKNGITIVKHYIDRAISAKTDNRPEFQQMIKDSDKKLFDIVLVWKLDRFARNRYDSARYKTQLKKNGVKLMSATEIISEGPEGIILESVLEGYAEYYSADLAEKVVRGQTENILKGRCNGGRGTFGYTLDSERKFHIDPLTSPFVLESFKKYNEGSTIKFRVTETEKMELQCTAKLLHLSLSTLIRRALHNAKIERTVVVAGGGEETLTAVSTLLAQCSRVGGNLNQLARHFNSGGADTEQLRAKLLDELADLTAFRLNAEKVLGKLLSLIHISEPTRPY